jgi:hypothetical protein
VPPFHILIILICAALGFGIVMNVLGPSKKPNPPDDDPAPW